MFKQIDFSGLSSSGWFGQPLPPSQSFQGENDLTDSIFSSISSGHVDDQSNTNQLVTTKYRMMNIGAVGDTELMFTPGQLVILMDKTITHRNRGLERVAYYGLYNKIEHDSEFQGVTDANVNVILPLTGGDTTIDPDSKGNGITVNVLTVDGTADVYTADVEDLDRILSHDEDFRAYVHGMAPYKSHNRYIAIANDVLCVIPVIVGNMIEMVPIVNPTHADIRRINSYLAKMVSSDPRSRPLAHVFRIGRLNVGKRADQMKWRIDIDAIKYKNSLVAP